MQACFENHLFAEALNDLDQCIALLEEDSDHSKDFYGEERPTHSHIDTDVSTYRHTDLRVVSSTRKSVGSNEELMEHGAGVLRARCSEGYVRR